MSKVKADIEALQELRQALLTFAKRQLNAVEEVEYEIVYTERVLDEAEQHWHHRVEVTRERLENCLVEAAYAAAECYDMDCSKYDYDFRQAEQRLVHILEVRHHVKQTIEEYQPFAYNYTKTLDQDPPAAVAFLDKRIEALEAFYETMELGAAATVVAGVGLLVVMGSVVAAIRGSRSRLNQLIGSTGEQVSSQVLSGKFGLNKVALRYSLHDFGQVFSAPGIPLLVIESLLNAASSKTSGGEQDSSELVAGQRAQHDARGSSLRQPTSEQIEQLVQEIGGENAPQVVILVNPGTNLGDVYVKQVNAGWQLSNSGVSLAQDQSQLGQEIAQPVEQKEGNLGNPEQRG